MLTSSNWSDVWLHEGFASYYEVKGVTAVDPSMYYVSRYFA